MKNFKLKEQDRDLLKKVYSFSQKEKINLFIVGGYLRDMILNRKKDSVDIDFCLKNKSINFSRKLANELKAGFVVLDKERGSCRLVKKIDDQVYTLDFTDFRGKTLEEDLLHRDFSINSIALNLKDALKSPLVDGGDFIDLYNGQKDIVSKIIKVINKQSFPEDPLRILRAFSLSCIFGFKIDESTIKKAQLQKNKLLNVSGERVRDELFKILDSDCTYNCLKLLDKLNILKVIIPEIERMRAVNQGPYHHLDILEHSFESVKQIEKIFEEFKNNQDFQIYINEILSFPRKRKSLLKLGAFLHDIGKPQTMRRKEGKIIFHGHECVGGGISKTIARRLKFSNDEIDALRKMVFWHLRPGYMADAFVLTKRAKFRFFRDTAKEAVSVLALSLADQRSTRGPLTLEEARLQHEKVVHALIKEYFKKLKEKKIEHLINGFDLMRKFKLASGPLIGKILLEIEELQATGQIKTKKEALLRSAKIIKKEGAKNGPRKK